MTSTVTRAFIWPLAGGAGGSLTREGVADELKVMVEDPDNVDDP